MSITPKSSWPWVKALLHSVYDQPDAASVHAQFDRVLDTLSSKLPAVAEHLDAARADVLAFTAFPKEIWRQIWSNNPPRAPQPRDPPAHRRRRHLPRPPRRDPPCWRRPRRAARRVDRRTALPRTRRPRPLPRPPRPRPSRHRGGDHHDHEHPPGAQRLTHRRSRGNTPYTTPGDLTLAADLACRPLVVLASPGQRSDARGLMPVLGRLRLPRRGPGRPRSRPDRVLGDKAYSSAGIRAYLRRRGIAATIPVKDDQAANRRARGSAGGRPPTVDKAAYRDRNTVERAVARLKRYRAVALGTDKRLFVFTGTVNVATLDLWLRDATRQDPTHTA